MFLKAKRIIKVIIIIPFTFVVRAYLLASRSRIYTHGNKLGDMCDLMKTNFTLHIFFNVKFMKCSEQKIEKKRKNKRNNRSPRIFEFKSKTMVISGLLLYGSYTWDMGY